MMRFLLGIVSLVPWSSATNPFAITANGLASVVRSPSSYLYAPTAPRGTVMVDEIPDNRRLRPLLSDHEKSVIWLASRELTPEEIGFQLGMSPVAVQALALALRRVLHDTAASLS